MTNFDILVKFLEMYPQFHAEICQWAPVGFNRITVWFRNGQVFDFTYYSDQNWNLVNHKSYRNVAGSYVGRYL